MASARKKLSFIVAVVSLAAAGAARAESLAFSHASTVYADANGGPLRAPEGVACTDSGRFVVADTGNARASSSTPRRTARSPAGTEIKLPQLTYPCACRSTRRGTSSRSTARPARSSRLTRTAASAGTSSSRAPRAS